MKMCAIRCILVLIILISVSGCETRLTSKVEIYNPEARLVELRQQRGTGAPTELEKEIIALLQEREKKCADQQFDPKSWLDLVIARVNAHQEYLGSAVSNLVKAYPASKQKGPEFNATTNTIVKAGTRVIQTTAGEIESLKQKYLNQQMSLPQVQTQVDAELATFPKEFTEAVFGKGDPKFLPKPLQELSRQSGNLPALLQTTYGTAKMNWTDFNRSGAQALAEPLAPMDGVNRPDKITETYTDTLLNLALRDKAGWSEAPAATMYAGIPNLGGGVSEGTTVGVASPADDSVSKTTMNVTAIINIAQSRDKRVQELLASRPRADASKEEVVKWLDQVNGLLTPTKLVPRNSTPN